MKVLNDWPKIGTPPATATGVDGGPVPGDWTMRSVARLLSGRSPSFAYTGFGPSTYSADSSWFVKYHQFFQFETLGTYVITIGTTFEDTNGNSLTVAEPFTFHVGPMAELEVRQGDKPDYMIPGRRAYVIGAANNGPDRAPAVQALIEGLLEGAYVDHLATGGSFNPVTGVWDLGELMSREEARFYPKVPGSHLLVIYVDESFSGDISASISNTEDYYICLNNHWC